MKKVLVAYATRGGSTQLIAETVMSVLHDAGYDVECTPAKDVASFKDYECVVFGSAIRAGRLMSELMKCIRKHRTVLFGKKVAAFAVCLTIKDDTPENREAVSTYLDPIRRMIPLVSEAVLAGGVSFARLGVFARFIIQKMAKAQEGDYRDQRKIAEWAQDVANRFRYSE